MAMNLYDGTNHNGLFDLQGKLFQAVADLNAARLTSVPAGVNNYLNQYLKLVGPGVTYQQAVDQAAASLLQWQRGGSSLSQWLQQRASLLLAAFVGADSPQPVSGDTNNLNYLIAQMISTSQYVTPSTVSLTLATVSGANDVQIVFARHRGDGLMNQHAIPEVIAVSITSNPVTSPTLKFLGKLPETDKLAWDWPLGSGCQSSVTATDPAKSLLPNGNFENSTVNANVPDGWTVTVGVPGTTVLTTLSAIQTLTESGTPTGGFFYLQWTDANSITWTTGPLAYNCTAGAVQTALRAIHGFAKITVTATGTAPNQVFTVTFTGVAGDIAALVPVSQLTGGTPSLVVATTQHGDAGAFKGQALYFAGNEVELTTIYSPALSLTPDVVYFAAFRCRGSGTTPTGTIVADIVGSIGGSALNDDAGNQNSLTFAATGVPTNAHAFKSFAFRLPASQTGPVYLRLRLTQAIDDGFNLYFDEAAVFAATELYAGGPFVGAVSGKLPVLTTDTWTLTVANDRAGVIHEWYNRTFDLAGKRLLLPGTGSSLIPSSVVS
ncbi:MAG TPA: hypothetical protein VG125_10510 [Pirellulales bacterium]|jgi:hypothetical protein|nr:hypothetical protein [Pirellulales bacterium]